MLAPPHSLHWLRSPRADRCRCLRAPCTECAADRAHKYVCLRTICTYFAPIAPPSVLTDVGTSTFFALAALPTVRTDAASSTLIAPTVLPPVIAFHMVLYGFDRLQWSKWIGTRDLFLHDHTTPSIGRRHRTVPCIVSSVTNR